MNKVFKYVVLFLVMLCVVVIAKFYLAEVPSAVIKGSSMLPLLREGDIVFIAKAGPSDIKVGDIIVYKSNYDTYIIHRVVGILIVGNEYYYVTKGDNNIMPDYWQFGNYPGIPYERVVGKVVSVGNAVFKIPYIGHLALMFRH